MARVTLQTIADQVGVSRMTVSNAFSRPDQLSAEVRARVLATAKRLGYVGPDPAARALARGTTGAVGVLLTDSLRYAFTDEVATGFLSAIVDELAPTGLALTLLSSDGRADVVPARDVAIDGALVYSCQPDSEAREWLLRRGVPVVFVDQRPEAGIPSVNVEDRDGARTAARHLLDLGHDRIAIVTVALGATPGVVRADPRSITGAHPQEQRMAGWLDALDEAGVTPTVVVTPRHDEDDACAAAYRVLVQADPPTGVLCFSDVLARGVVRAAHDAGLVVPTAVSVVGFDDSPIAHRTDPQLTTVRQDVSEKGRLAAAMLTATVERAAAGGTRRARHHLLPTELVVRASTAPPGR